MTGSNAAEPVAPYTRMDEGAEEDYALQAELAAPFVATTGERVLAYLEELASGLPGFRVDRYEQSLQTATRVLRGGSARKSWWRPWSTTSATCWRRRITPK